MTEEDTPLEYMRINDYARLRGIKPQRVHYYIRNKRLKKFTCACGGKVIRIADADKVLDFKEE